MFVFRTSEYFGNVIGLSSKHREAFLPVMCVRGLFYQGASGVENFKRISGLN